MKGLDTSRPLSLYIHVPFCTRKCDYCAFYSLPLSSVDNAWIDRYTSIILSELDALNRDYGKCYRSVFIGGGNPGVLGIDRLRAILAKAEENGMPQEVTIEINPENITEDISSLSSLLTRVSVGIQSMSDEVLSRLGRNARREDNIKALRILSQSPYIWNADIITAVPGESVERTLQDIDEISSFSPDHISFYCLTFEENTPLIAREKPLGEDKEAEFLLRGWEKLRALGYEHYEISNFAKPGKRCIHNSVYWNLGQYVGFGPGAESSVGYESVVSMRDSETLEEFLQNPQMTCTPLTREETIEEYLLTALRTSDGIDKAEYSERFSSSFDEIALCVTERYGSDMYINDSEHFALTEKGFMMLDRIILSLAMGL